MEIRKLIKDGKVGVVLAKSFDIEGWYTSHKDLQLLFLPELVNLVESDEYENYESVHKLLTSMGIWDFTGATNGLKVERLPVDTRFKVEIRDCIVRGYYNEVIVTNDDDWITA